MQKFACTSVQIGNTLPGVYGSWRIVWVKQDAISSRGNMLHHRSESIYTNFKYRYEVEKLQRKCGQQRDSQQYPLFNGSQECTNMPIHRVYKNDTIQERTAALVYGFVRFFRLELGYSSHFAIVFAEVNRDIDCCSLFCENSEMKDPQNVHPSKRPAKSF